MPGWTNRGKKRILDYFFRRVGTLPSTFYAALCTSVNTPGPDTNTMADMVEIAVGNGYSAGGLSLSPLATYFPSVDEDDANDRGVLSIGDFGWTASGGTLPVSGGGARWLVLTDDNPTPANRDVLCYWDLGADRQVTSGQYLGLFYTKIRMTE